MFEVKWTGSWPCLCSGEWIIYRNGVNVSNLIPREIRFSNMNTAGTYSAWHFNSDWDEIWEDYEDGLECETWIENNHWIYRFCETHAEAVELFHEIAASDWREGSCGGCI